MQEINNALSRTSYGVSIGIYFNATRHGELVRLWRIKASSAPGGLTTFGGSNITRQGKNRRISIMTGSTGMGRRVPQFTIILAGGKGTRMGSTARHKVCFPLDGQPVIHRVLDIYRACGIPRQILVVGFLAEQVIETVRSKHDHIIFAHQNEPLGTAHAVRQGLAVLDRLVDETDVLLAAGDRIIHPDILKALFDLYYQTSADLALPAVPRRGDSDQGRLVIDDQGRVLGVVEAVDIRQRRVFCMLRKMSEDASILSHQRLLEVFQEGFAQKGKTPEAIKFKKAFGALWQTVAEEKHDLSADDLRAMVPEASTRFAFGGESVRKTPDEVDQARWLNASVYLVKSSALRYALSKLNRNNAQQEEYLSDIVGILASADHCGKPRFSVEYLGVRDPNHVLGFNTPSELLEIETLLKSPQKKPPLGKTPPPAAGRSIGKWLDKFEKLASEGRSADARLWEALSNIYGERVEIIRERIEAYIDVLGCAADLLGADTRVIIVRSPGRVNVMSRHIDHQGGVCNLMSIGCETLMVVQPREDDLVKLYSTAPDRFPMREFSIGSLMADLPWDNWRSLIESEAVTRIVHKVGGDWAQYIKAALLRLQKRFPDIRLCGMEMVVGGNIPIAAGLSSSSSLVVGAAEAAVSLNRLTTLPAQLVDLCGEGEWFVGTRGGSADHAAIKLGQKGKVLKVAFFDFRILETVPFPKAYVLAVCASGIESQKTVETRNLFNHRICCYRIGFLLIKKFLPQYAPVLNHLRDVNIRNLDVPLEFIYRLLLRLPETATRDELRDLLPDRNLEDDFSQHHPPPDGLYPIRGVVLFGLAEMERAKRFADAMKTGRMDIIGRMMNVSHDGDRIISIGKDGAESEFRAPTSDTYLWGLIEDLKSGNRHRTTSAQLQWQPGSYRCSLPDIDRMVDISLGTDGVVGAQLSGAGLGGCMMVLSHREAVQDLRANLTEQYYQKHQKKPSILICRPVAGSGVLKTK